MLFVGLLISILVFIGYCLYYKGGTFLLWLIGLFYIFLFVFIVINGLRIPVVKRVDTSISKQGETVYKYSDPKKSCPWGKTYYCVIKTDSVKPNCDDLCIHCQKPYNYHGGLRTYDNESDYNLSVIADYAFSL